jgi:hypothetical protein
MTLYAQSKFVGLQPQACPFSLTIKRQGNVVFAKELARRYGEMGIVSIALNPGTFDCTVCFAIYSCPVAGMVQGT